MHNSEQPHAGSIVCTFDPDFIALARRIHEAIAAEMDMTGLLLRVNRL